MMRVDFHCHTRASDGALTPQALVERAISLQLDLLAITDHDTVAGLSAANHYLSSQKSPLKLIAGVEISCLWRDIEIHILGLNIDPKHPVLTQFLSDQKQRRLQRAHAIAAELEKLGFEAPFEKTQRIAGDGAITRAHFALYLVQQGVAQEQGDIFKSYLARDKPGYVPFDWPPIQRAVEVICAAGGKAVLAHPMRYKLTTRQLKKLLTAFKSYGGIGLEVISSQQSTQERYNLTQWALAFDFEASCGSDFHRPSHWRDLGQNLQLPPDLKPIWHDF